jgi:hypothetical protein
MQMTPQLLAVFIRNTILMRTSPNEIMRQLELIPNPFYGECYVASALLYEMFDGKNMQLYKKKDYKYEYHWWIKLVDTGEIIDITAEQYSIDKKPCPSADTDGAIKAELMWFPSYKKRVAKLKKELLDYIDIKKLM